jgi:hypothetical protein
MKDAARFDALARMRMTIATRLSRFEHNLKDDVDPRPQKTVFWKNRVSPAKVPHAASILYAIFQLDLSIVLHGSHTLVKLLLEQSSFFPHPCRWIASAPKNSVNTRRQWLQENT